METATKPKNKSSIDLKFFDRFFNKVNLVNKLFFTQQLEVMIRTGFSLAKALDTISLQMENKNFKNIITVMKNEVEKGTTLSKAASAYPKVFSETYTSMLSAGEASGKLDEVLKRLTIQLKKSYEIKAKVKNALTYPIVVLIAMVVIGVAMLIFVVPKITSIYKEANAKLPLPTTILMGVTDFVLANGIYIAIALVIIVFITVRFAQQPKGKKIFHALYLKLPIVAPIIKKYNLANFARNLSSLLKTDIPIVQTFHIISRTASNVLYQEHLAAAAEELKKGVSVKTTLEKNPKLFPPLVTQIVNIGEESGTLDSISEEIAAFYEEEVTQTMENLATLIEPILMLVLGVGVGLVAVAVIMPMYSLVNQI